MYAVIVTGGKQYKVSPGDLLPVEKLAAQPGDTVEFDEVLMVGQDDGPLVDRAQLEGAKVIGRVEEQGRAKKVIVFKFKRRKGYRRKRGHRQYLSRVRINEITL